MAQDAPASRRRPRRSSLAAVLDATTTARLRDNRPGFEQARSSLFNCVFRGKAFGRVEKGLKAALMGLLVASVVVVLIESAAELQAPGSTAAVALRAFFEVVEWAFFAAMLLELLVRVAVMDWTPGFWETSLVAEIALRRSTGDRAAEGLAATCLRCGPCHELNQRPVGVCRTMRFGLCCPVWHLCSPLCCPSDVTVLCCRALTGWMFERLCCFDHEGVRTRWGRAGRDMSQRRGLCHAASALNDAEVVAVLLAGAQPTAVTPSSPDRSGKARGVGGFAAERSPAPPSKPSPFEFLRAGGTVVGGKAASSRLAPLRTATSPREDPKLHPLPQAHTDEVTSPKPVGGMSPRDDAAPASLSADPATMAAEAPHSRQESAATWGRSRAKLVS
ncbi:hypothetical protein FNF27_04873 [Cafeteria roenbergensis]|uniref:Ion transport domain-containing protein n=1 Tax=Cafeteria roenbergensis TaxID=33653 RepID=A0A5A8E956_CAFRO|nr:hypothetical protein FNF27_04873 [Cafeteria roenbergensis]